MMHLLLWYVICILHFFTQYNIDDTYKQNPE